MEHSPTTEPSTTPSHYEGVVVLPARDEAAVLARSVDYLLGVTRTLPGNWLVLISENGSRDGTSEIAEGIARDHTDVDWRRCPETGKGAAIRAGWESVEARYYFFIDVDLSAEPRTGLPLCYQTLQDGASLALGSRFRRGAQVDRPAYRQFISRGYRLVARLLTGTRISDLPCGLKGVTAAVCKTYVPQVQSQTWFFDSELVLLAEAAGERITQIPVTWTEYRYGERRRRVPIIETAIQYVDALLAIRPYLEQVRSRRTREQ